MPSIQDRMKECGLALSAYMVLEPQIDMNIGAITKRRAKILQYEEFMQDILEVKIGAVDLKKADALLKVTEQCTETLDNIAEAKKEIKEIKKTVRDAIAAMDKQQKLIEPLLAQFTAELKANSLDGCNDGDQKIKAHIYIQRVRKALQKQIANDHFGPYRK